MMEIRRGRYRGSDDCFYYIFGQGFYRETSQRFVILFREDRGLEDLAGVNEARVQAADGDDVDAGQSILLVQQQREEGFAIEVGKTSEVPEDLTGRVEPWRPPHARIADQPHRDQQAGEPGLQDESGEPENLFGKRWWSHRDTALDRHLDLAGLTGSD